MQKKKKKKKRKRKRAHFYLFSKDLCVYFRQTFPITCWKSSQQYLPKSATQIDKLIQKIEGKYKLLFSTHTYKYRLYSCMCKKRQTKTLEMKYKMNIIRKINMPYKRLEHYTWQATCSVNILASKLITAKISNVHDSVEISCDLPPIPLYWVPSPSHSSRLSLSPSHSPRLSPFTLPFL